MSALGKIIDFQTTSNSVVAQNSDKLIAASFNDNALISEGVIAKKVDEPRSIEELLFDNRASLKTIAVRYGLSHLDETLRLQLFQQIDWILDEQEWEDLDSFADQESFKTLIRFILNANPVKAPYLNISDDGHLIATWISGENKLRLECFSNDRTKWFVSCKIDGESERAEGNSSSLQRLLDHLTPFKKAGWFKL